MCSAMRCAICSIPRHARIALTSAGRRRCAPGTRFTTSRRHTMQEFMQLRSAVGRAALAGALMRGAAAPGAGAGRKAAVRRHPECRHGLRDLSALSWDMADWNWKQNHDTGQMYETLFAADLTKSKRWAASIPSRRRLAATDAVRGELAESWRWKENPLRLEVKLRKGVMFPEKPGVMAARELVADDVVFSYTRLDTSPKKIPHLLRPHDQGRGHDKHTVVFTFKDFFAEWDYRFGWGYYSGIMPKEVADAGAVQLEEPERHRPVPC
jgi:ABC-type transport system substrate-binding protein